jgi:hypothetical protein
VHEAKLPSSSEHSKVAASFAENSTDVPVARVRPLGASSIAVSGAAVSTTKERLAGVPSTLPAASRARTSNVCSPSARAAVS